MKAILAFVNSCYIKNKETLNYCSLFGNSHSRDALDIYFVELLLQNLVFQFVNFQSPKIVS